MASDLAQDTFLKFYNLSPKNTILHPRAYLYRMARNIALDYLKQSQPLQNLEESSHFIADENANKQDEILQREQAEQKKKIIEKALAELPPQARIVFEKSRMEGKKYQQISDELKISLKTVEAHMTKALKIIRNFIRVNRDNYSLFILLTLLYAAS